MRTFNGNKMIKIEIHSNDGSGANGYTIYAHGENRRAMSRRADGKDFDWMTDKQMKDFEAGKSEFKISAQDALDYFSYLY